MTSYVSGRRSGIERRHNSCTSDRRIRGDRRTPTSVATAGQPCNKPISLQDCCGQQLRALCISNPDSLVHLYWPQREQYFYENIERLRKNYSWLLVATPGHGLRKCSRPSLNFIVPDGDFLNGYPAAAVNRGFVHGLLIRRQAIYTWSNRRGFEVANVSVIPHPNVLRDHHINDDWKYDIGRKRYGAVDELDYAKFVRLATPNQDNARRVLIPEGEIVAWWRFSPKRKI